MNKFIVVENMIIDVNKISFVCEHVARESYYRDSDDFLPSYKTKVEGINIFFNNINGEDFVWIKEHTIESFYNLIK